MSFNRPRMFGFSVSVAAILLSIVLPAHGAANVPYVISSGDASRLRAVDGNVFFVANTRELWRTDGAAAGTVLIRSFSREVDELTIVGRKVFFTIGGSELWVTDGTAIGTLRLQEFFSPAQPAVSRLFASGATLFFQGHDGVTGEELWKSDGTVSGTQLVADINPTPIDPSHDSGVGWSNPQPLATYAGYLYFAANDGRNGEALWRSDGSTAGTTIVLSSDSAAPIRYPGEAVVHNGQLYIVASDNGGAGLWRANGTSIMPVCFPPAYCGLRFNRIEHLTVIGGKLYFAGWTDGNGAEWWVSSGWWFETQLLKDINPGSANGYVGGSLAAFGTGALFYANDGVHGIEPWFTNGTAAGTLLVRDINPGIEGSTAYPFPPMVSSNDGVYFGAHGPLLGAKMWRSDGTPGGTSMVAEIDSTSSYGPREFVSTGRDLFFTTFSNLFGMTTCEAPAPPTEVVAARSNGSASVTWTASAGAVSYDIYRSFRECPGDFFEKTGETSSTEFVDSTAGDGVASYQVKAVSAAGCESLPSACAVDLCTLPSPQISFSGSTSACGSGTGGTATADPTSDSQMQYLWGYRAATDGSFIAIPWATSRSYTLSARDFSGAGSYLLACRTVSSCGVESFSNEIPVTITESAATPHLYVSDACAGGRGSAGVEEIFPSYAWTISNGTIDGPSNLQRVNFRAGSSWPVRLTVTVTDNGGCTATSDIDVPAANVPAPVINLFGSTTACSGQTRPAAARDTYATYQWTATNATIESGSTAALMMFTPGTSGPVLLNLTVTTTDGCSATSTVEIPILPAGTSTITAAGPLAFCEGGGVTLTANPGDSYFWSTWEGTQSIRVSSTGDYWVEVMTEGSCAVTSSTVHVSVSAPSVVTVTPNGPLNFCEGGSVVLSASGAGSYLWSNGATTRSITVTATGDYSVTAGNGGCSSTSAPVHVTVNPLPSATVSANGPTNFCEGGSVVLTASSGSSYLWSNGATMQSITVSTAGDYSVTVTNANGCSSTSTPIHVNVNQLPSANVSANGPTTFCEGQSVVLTAPAGMSYLWSNGATTQSINVSTAGDYSVTVTNAGGCSATSAPTHVTVTPLPKPTITAGGPTTFCEGGSVLLTATAGASYLWSNGAATQSITVSSSGDYSVSVTNVDGCSATSASTHVAVTPRPTATITAGGPTSFCEGGSVLLTATSGSSYLWSNGATTQSINVTASGDYSVTVTNADGCSATSAATHITVNAQPQAVITSNGPTTFCDGGSVVLTANTGSSYLWSNGATAQSITVATSGDYSVRVANASGCSAVSSVTHVTVNARPLASITANGPLAFCQGGSVVLTASPASSYLWSTGATTQSITVNTAGTYSVRTTSAEGCSNQSASVTTSVTQLPTATVTGGGTICLGGSASVTATLTGAAPWTITWSDGVIQSGIMTSTVARAVSPSATTAYSVSLVSGNSCSGTSSGSALVTVNRPPAITVQPASVTIRKNTATTLSVAATGTTPLSYQWYRGTTGNTSTPVGTNSASYVTPKLSVTTSYWVRVTNACDQTNSSTATVTVR